MIIVIADDSTIYPHDKNISNMMTSLNQDLFYQTSFIKTLWF